MIVEQVNGKYTDFRIPGIVATERGTLLRYCECRKTQSDWAEIDIEVKRSEDNGERWTTVLLIEGKGATLNNPVMFVDGERLVFLYCKNYKEIWKCVSFDDGKSFKDAERVNFEQGVGFPYSVVALGPGHGIVHQGRLIVPMWFAYNQDDSKKHYPSFASTFYSDDHGMSWRVGELIYPDRLINASEGALAVMSDGSVLLSLRHDGAEKTRALAKSRNGISEWHDLRLDDKMHDPTCMGSMTHRNGTVYHVNCDSQNWRKNLTLKVSENGFESYSKMIISDIGGYSDIAVLGDKLFVLYEKTVVNNLNKWDPFCLYFEAIGI